MESNEALAYLGLMKKAGKLAVGAEAVVDACGHGRCKLILAADDIASNTLSWLIQAAEKKEIRIISPGFDKHGLGGALGVGQCACAGISDTGFAISLCQKLGLNELKAELEQRMEREKRRKAKKLAGKTADKTKRGK